MGKLGTPLNSSAFKPELQQQANAQFKAPNFQATYKNSKRKHSKYGNLYGRIYPDDHNYLHLNSLWSIWYGILLTLFQGYLAIHGASRFLGCSLITWKIEPVAELNVQIVLSGVVFVLLPFFFTSAVFKVGNMANDGVKLASTSKVSIYAKIAQDGFGEESHIGSMKTLWVHGGPTAAFIHILIALCLLLPRLLLEGRIIENEFLPRETIWHTELDFIVANNSLVVLSIKSSKYQNNTLLELLVDENSYNHTKVDIQTNIHENPTNLLYNNLRQEKNHIFIANGKKKNEEAGFADLTGAAVKRDDSNIFVSSDKSSIVTPHLTVELGGASLTNENIKNTNKYDFGAVTVANIDYSNLTQKFTVNSKSENKLISFPAQPVSYNTYHNKQYNRLNNHNGKIIRKHNRHRKPNQQLFSYEKKDMLKDNKYLKFDLKNISKSNNINVSNKSQMYGEHAANKVHDSAETITTYLKRSTPNRTAIRDSDIHIVKAEKIPEIVQSTPVSTNSKIIEIKQKVKRAVSYKEANLVNIEPQLFLNESIEYVAETDSIVSYNTSTVQSTLSDENVVHLDGFAGMLQLLFGVKKPIDVKTFHNPPSAEFLNFLFALLVWCVRYPAVFWTTAKSFASIFSLQMIVSAMDIIFSYVGISTLFKLQIYSQGQPIQYQGLILNASVTLALFLLSVVLILSSSMVLYLFGHGRLLTKMRDRSIISLSSNKSWIYFAHCSSLCYILALSVVKAPLLNDLTATYRKNLDYPTFVAVLVSAMHILLWIMMWMVLTFKSKWSFKLPPLDTYSITGKATTNRLLMQNNGSLTNTTTGILSNSTNSTAASVNTAKKLKCGNTSHFLTIKSSTNALNDATKEEIYWPNITPSSPKLKDTLNEVTNRSEDDHHHRLFDESNDKRNSFSRASAYFTSIKGETDDGEYATLRSDTALTLGNVLTSSCGTKNSTDIYKNYAPSDSVDSVHTSECNEFPPPPPNMTSSMTITNQFTTVFVNPKSNSFNILDDCASKILGVQEEGQLFQLDDSVTNASTKGVETLLPSMPTSKKTESVIESNGSFMLNEKYTLLTECIQPSQASEYLVSSLAPIKVALHTNEAHIFHNATTRCLRSADVEVAHEALSPRSDANSFATEFTISPPDRAPSESSSGIHSAEEREIEVIIRPRTTLKNASKLPPPSIQEEPNNRCTNMRMSSFTCGNNLNSATLPSQRSNADEKFDYSQYCTTMPLPTITHKQNNQQIRTAVYATSAQFMSKPQSTFGNVSSFKKPLYVNSGFAVSGHKQRLCDQHFYTRNLISPQPEVTHTILPNGLRYSNPNILRRHPFLKVSDPQSSLAKSTIHEDRDSANYSMISDQGSIYITSNSLS